MTAGRTKQKTYTAKNVAKYLIYLASREFIGDNREREGITNLKLQKVLYFAQVHYLTILNRPLFSDKIEAWEYGPVVPGVYRQYRSKGSNPIISEEDTSTLSDGDKKETEQIWRYVRREYSASKLDQYHPRTHPVEGGVPEKGQNHHA